MVDMQCVALGTKWTRSAHLHQLQPLKGKVKENCFLLHGVILSFTVLTGHILLETNEVVRNEKYLIPAGKSCEHTSKFTPNPASPLLSHLLSFPFSEDQSEFNMVPLSAGSAEGPLF